MTDAEKREKIIKGLECCEKKVCIFKDTEKECPYWELCGEYVSEFEDCTTALAKDALALLKVQEPRVMTLGDLRDIGSVWELNTPPYLWMEINPSYRWTRGFWVAWREIYDMIDGLHPTYDADNYGKTWRCWTSRPDEKRREETPWE